MYDAEYHREYREKHLEEIKAYQKEYHEMRRKGIKGKVEETNLKSKIVRNYIKQKVNEICEVVEKVRPLNDNTKIHIDSMYNILTKGTTDEERKKKYFAMVKLYRQNTNREVEFQLWLNRLIAEVAYKGCVIKCDKMEKRLEKV